MRTEIKISGKGEEKSVPFEVERKVYGSYELEVSGRKTSFTVVRPAGFTTSDLQITPTLAGQKQSITISVVVNNSGDSEGPYYVTLKINHAIEKTEEVTLASGTSQEVPFVVSKDSAGTYEVQIDDLTGEFMVDPTAEGAEDDTSWYLWIAVAVVGGILIVGVTVVLVLRRS